MLRAGPSSSESELNRAARDRWPLQKDQGSRSPVTSKAKFACLATFGAGEIETAGMPCRFMTGRGSGLRRVSSRSLALALRFLLAASLAAPSGIAQAQEWPTRFVKVSVPYGPGGISDVLARITADRLGSRLGQQFIVETHPGASGALGTEYAVRSPADGYTLYFGGGAQVSVVPLMQKLSYDPLKDLAPISIVASNGMALAVNRDLPVHSVREFIDYARANP